MSEEYPQILIPAINEVFHTLYREDEKVILYRNEHHEKDGEIITDVYVGIKDSFYHIECQERMDEVMGGHVLELESIKIIHQERVERRAEGISVGDARRLLSSVNGVMEKFGISLEEACDAIDVTLEQYEAAKKLVGEQK